ncbi:SET domain-containing protein 9 [Holothuria leucospilota]|uniref:SET domain-containing protein 9 n=1 Tax=Holothuria leucospilota TaxID=206669 RepID=A0A9Q1C8Q0_HOLLE|nr:SET domain-containing protein 9 [Holothuria leucospilota]
MQRRLKAFWESYKYRFVPWIVANLKNRSARSVSSSQDDILTHVEVEESLLDFFNALARNDRLPSYGMETERSCQDLESKSESEGRQFTRGSCKMKKKKKDPLEVMFENCGFAIECSPSRLKGGGTGVLVTKGVIPRNSVVAMYPGTVYLPSEPILLQSVGNPFIFRCSDGLLIDGFNRRISKIIYKSCSQRDRLGTEYLSSDLTWVTKSLQNPMNVGQFVNNHTKEYSANVAYQEFDVSHRFPIELRKYLPNVFYSANLLHQRPLRTVVLISLRNIQAGEELLSSYFTLIH